MDARQTAENCANAMMGEDAASRGLGIDLVAIAPGTATMTMKVRKDMLNGHKICHGGFIFTLADSAFAFACNTYNQITVAASADISFLAPAHLDDTLTATAAEQHRAGRSGVYDISVTNQDGNLVALFRGKSRTIGKPGSIV